MAFVNPDLTVDALVSDTPESYVDGAIKPISLTSDGRLRASIVLASIPTYEEITPVFDMTSDVSPFGDPSTWPWA